MQSADCGIGVEGKEGRQASLAAGFSISQFRHLRRLLFVHGRKAYKGSAVLAQFVIHRGILITTMQVIYSALFYFAAVGIFPSILLVGYATIFTMFPVFSLVLDEDVSPALAMRFPELYKWLTRGREFSYKQFFLWSTISIFQGTSSAHLRVYRMWARSHSQIEHEHITRKWSLAALNIPRILTSISFVYY